VLLGALSDAANAVELINAASSGTIIFGFIFCVEMAKS
jgi:hypothetical protein